MEAMPNRWTDNRMDDLAQRVESGFASVDQRFTDLHEDNRQLRREMIALRTEVRTDSAKLRDELKAHNQKLRDELKADNKKLGIELHADIEKLSTEFHADIEKLSIELHADIEKLSASTDDRFKALERRFDILIGTVLSGVVGLVLSRLLG